MAKTFEKRVSKKDRTKIDLTANLPDYLLRKKDEMLLRGAQLQNVKLKDITVRKQVRTKFNDESLQELADNIRENGLIQPLVLHREGNKFVLICGERRFRAMSTIDDMIEAPCFILENKTQDELMAIQFSENSSREDLHYIDQADSIYSYQKTTGASERKIQAALGTSKSEVHRSLMIAQLPVPVKEAAKKFNIEKYVLLEWNAITATKLKKDIEKLLLQGELTKRAQLKKMLRTNGKDHEIKRTLPLPKDTTANAFLKALDHQAKNKKIDKKTEALLRELLSETQQVLDL